MQGSMNFGDIHTALTSVEQPDYFEVLRKRDKAAQAKARQELLFKQQQEQYQNALAQQQQTQAQEQAKQQYLLQSANEPVANPEYPTSALGQQIIGDQIPKTIPQPQQLQNYGEYQAKELLHTKHLKEAQEMNRWAKDKIDLAKDFQGEDGDLSTIFESLAEQFEARFGQTNNPYLKQQSDQLREMSVLKKRPKEYAGTSTTKQVVRYNDSGKLEYGHYEDGEFVLESVGKKSATTTGRYVANDAEAESWAKAVREKRITIDKVPAYGGLRAKVGNIVENQTKEGIPVHYMGDIADFAAGKTSQTLVTKQLDMSRSFIDTIDSNIAQLNNHIKAMAERHSMPTNKIMNMGVRSYNKFVGDSDINIYDMLVNAISTENAKLVSGGAGSVAQVAEGARAEMDKIHNKNLPISEMVKLLKATRQEGSNRIAALEKQRTRSSERSQETRNIKPPESLDRFKSRMLKLYPNYSRKSPSDWKTAYSTIYK